MAQGDTPRTDQHDGDREVRPPADRSYGDSASDHAEPDSGADPHRPDSDPVRQDYDATAESTAAAEDDRTPYVVPPADDGRRDTAARRRPDSPPDTPDPAP